MQAKKNEPVAAVPMSLIKSMVSYIMSDPKVAQAIMLLQALDGLPAVVPADPPPPPTPPKPPDATLGGNGEGADPPPEP